MKISTGRGVLPVLLLALAGCINPADIGGHSGKDGRFERTPQDIIETWELMRPSYRREAYRLRPSSVAPYHAGLVSHSFAEDALKLTNFIRYLAYLPPTVALDSSLAERAQYGAVLLASTDDFAHRVARPAAMSEEFYLTAVSSTMTSNIARGFPSIESAIHHGYIRDDDLFNLRAVGHRRWILNPRFNRTGFGYAEGEHYTDRRVIGNSTMQVHDAEGPEVAYDYIAWPAPGYFPREFFDSDDPWTVTLNPERYLEPEFGSVSVRLTRLHDRRGWTFDAEDGEITLDREYFTVNLERYGVPNAIIFRPAPAELGVRDRVNMMGDLEIEPGTYRVEISGLRRRDGSQAPIRYDVTFFDLAPDLRGLPPSRLEVASGK